MIFLYNSLFVLLFGFLNINKLKSNKWKKIYLLICFFQMFLIQGLRDVSVGTDTSFYVNVYNNYHNNEYYSFLFTHYELGFQFLYNFLHYLNIDYQGMLLIVSGVTMLGFANFIYRTSSNLILSVFIFSCLLYPNSFNIMRQFLALSLSINAISLIFKEKYISSSILILFSSLFHTMSLLMFIPLILSLFKNWKLSIYILLLSCVIFFFFGSYIVNFGATIFNKQFYINNDFSVNRLFRTTTLITMIICIIMIYCTRFNKSKVDNKFKLLTCISIVNLNFGILYLKYEFMSRIIEMFNSFLLISFPLASYEIKTYYRPIIKIMVWAIPVVLLINSVFNSGSGIENYKFFFSN